MDERRNDDDEAQGGDYEVVHHANGARVERLRLDHRAVGADVVEHERTARNQVHAEGPERPVELDLRVRGERQPFEGLT